jgi:hypothetical protein
MNRRWTLPVVAALTGLTLVSTSGAALAQDHRSPGHGRGTATFAVIGDIPYGAEQLAQFPEVVDQINADPRVSLVNHLGDIKSGSTECTDAYFARIRAELDRFADPLVYTPGDNEWTDCHRPTNGAFNPLERLAAVRSVFFDRPGTSLGRRPARLRSQARAGYPENVRYRRDGVSFGLPHIVGSNNGLAPWTGQTTATPEQTAEVLGRTAASVELIRDTFATARQERDRAVVILTQADMFDPTVKDPKYADYYAYTPIVRALAEESAAFRGAVYLFNGDSHVFNVDRPLAAGSPWRSLYGVPDPVESLQRITVDGADNNDGYLRVTIHPRSRGVLTWTRVPYTG